MGDTLLSVEVLGEPERSSLSIVGADSRAGPIERKNGAYEFRFHGDACAASELLATLCARAFASPRSCAAKTTWKNFSSRSGRGSCRDELGTCLRDWLDNPILIKHVRSRLRPSSRWPRPWWSCSCSACASSGRDTRSIAFMNGRAFDGCSVLQGIILIVMGASQVGSAVGGARALGHS